MPRILRANDLVGRETRRRHAVLSHQVVQHVGFSRKPVAGVADDEIEHASRRPGAAEEDEPRSAAAARLDPATHRFVLQTGRDHAVGRRRLEICLEAAVPDRCRGALPSGSVQWSGPRVVAQSFGRDFTAQAIGEPQNLRVLRPIARDGPHEGRIVPARGFVCIIAPR